MSLRSRSTIIRFSARFFGSAASAAASAASRPASASRGAVPFIGRASMPPAPSSAKKSSGERDKSTASPSATIAPNPTGCRAASAAWIAAGSPRQRPSIGKRQVDLVDVAGPDVVGTRAKAAACSARLHRGSNGPSSPPAAAGSAALGPSGNTPKSTSGSRRPAGISGASRGSKA